MHLVRRRPHPVDFLDAWIKRNGRVMPLRGPASSVHHKIGKEREEAVRFVALRFAVLDRLLSEVCFFVAISYAATR